MPALSFERDVAARVKEKRGSRSLSATTLDGA